MENNVAESRLRRRVPEDGENSDSFLGRVRDYLVNGQAAARGGGQPDNIREETERLANFVVYSSLRWELRAWALKRLDWAFFSIVL